MQEVRHKNRGWKGFFCYLLHSEKRPLFNWKNALISRKFRFFVCKPILIIFPENYSWDIAFYGKIAKIRFWTLFDLGNRDEENRPGFWQNGVSTKIRPRSSEKSIFLKSEAILAQSTKCIRKCLKSPIWGYMGRGVGFQLFWSHSGFFEMRHLQKRRFYRIPPKIFAWISLISIWLIA